MIVIGTDLFSWKVRFLVKVHDFLQRYIMETPPVGSKEDLKWLKNEVNKSSTVSLPVNLNTTCKDSEARRAWTIALYQQRRIKGRVEAVTRFVIQRI